MANRGDTDFDAHLTAIPEFAAQIGRDNTDDFEIKIHGVPTEQPGLTELVELVELGVHRAVFVVGATDQDRTLRYLDQLAKLTEEIAS